jgi:WG repeat protein
VSNYDGRAKATEKLPRSEPKRDKNGKVVAHTDFRCGFIDRTGTLVVPRIFDDCQDFQEGRAAVWVAAQGWGIIDLEGRFVVSPQFTGAHGSPSFPRKFWQAGSGSGSVSGPERPGFSEGLMAVSNEDGYGYIDRDGKLVIGHRFRAASLFHDDLAVVVMPAEVGLGIQQGTLNLTNPREGYFTGVIDRAGRFVVPPVYDWAKVHPGGLVQVKFGDRIGYLDATGKPLTFSDKEIEAHVARMREQLKPPAPDRSVVGEAGDTSYYLHLPDGICAFNLGVPQDRKFLEDLQSKAAAEMVAAQQKMPQLPQEGWREMKKTTAELLKANSGLLTKCDQLKAIRSGADESAVRTYAFVRGMQKDRYDPSGNSGLAFMAALMCKLADRDSVGAPSPKDNSARVWNAFKRLESGESTALPALAYEGLACYSARVAPATEDAGAALQTPATAKVGFHTIFALPNWLVVIFAQETIAAGPEAFFRELDQQKALVRAFEDANLNKPAPSTRP